MRLNFLSVIRNSEKRHLVGLMDNLGLCLLQQSRQVTCEAVARALGYLYVRADFKIKTPPH